MIRRPPRSTQSRSSAASDVYKRQGCERRIAASLCATVRQKRRLTYCSKWPNASRSPARHPSLALRSEATVDDQLRAEDGVILREHGAECVGLEQPAEVAQVAHREVAEDILRLVPLLEAL